MYVDVLGDIRSRAGICSERPRGKAGRRGVVGLPSRALSSFDFRFSGSRNFGDGDSAGGPPSDRDRAFEGDLEAARLRGDPSLSSTTPSPAAMSRLRVSFN